jgi:hypothetical protein
MNSPHIRQLAAFSLHGEAHPSERIAENPSAQQVSAPGCAATRPGKIGI